MHAYRPSCSSKQCSYKLQVGLHSLNYIREVDAVDLGFCVGFLVFFSGAVGLVG